MQLRAWCAKRVQLRSLAGGSSASQHHLFRIPLFPWNCLGHPCGKSLDHKGQLRIRLWTLGSSPLISVCLVVLLCLGYSSFVVSFGIKSASLPCLFFFLKTVLTILGPLHFRINFRISVSTFAKKPAEMLVGTVLHLEIHLGTTIFLASLCFVNMRGPSVYLRLLSKTLSNF